LYQLRNHRSQPARSLPRPRRGFAAAVTALALGGLVLGAGCNKGDSSNPGSPGGNAGKVTGTIGFVDLDKVSAQIQWKADFENDFNAAKREAERQLTVFKDSVMAAWDTKKKDVAAAAHLNAEQVKALNGMNGQEIQKLPLTQAQKDDLGQSFAQANQALNAAQQKANQALSQREQKILESFREAMRPSVRRVAMAANISMVIAPPPNANPVFYYDPSVDLTDQVVDDMRKAMPQHTLPEMPKLNLPTDWHFNALPTPGASPRAPATTAPSTPR
jgi:Skp family chaperone for outer membrane proteins